MGRPLVLLTFAILLAVFGAWQYSLFRFAPRQLELASTRTILDQDAFEAAFSPHGEPLPFPFSKISSKVLAEYEHNHDVNEMRSVLGSVLIPHGRSKQDFATNMKHPRVLVTNGSHDQPYFIAYAKLANQLEVISWNNRHGQFDFLEVNNYTAQGIRRITKADRALCIQCHQSEGPIFSHEGWSETNGAERSSDVYDGLRRNLTGNIYEGVPIYNQMGALFFEARVTESTRLLQSRNVCENICVGNSECRYHLFELAVIDHARSSYIESASCQQARSAPFDMMKWSQQLLATWPVTGFAYIDPLIADTSISNVYPQFSDSRFVDPMARRDLTQAISLENAVDIVRDLASECLGFTESDRQELGRFSQGQLRSVFETSAVASLFSNERVEKATVMSQIRALLGGEKSYMPTDLWQEPASDVKAKEVTLTATYPSQWQLGPTDKADRPTYQLFGKYCLRCHGANGIDIGLRSAASLKAYKNGLAGLYVDRRFNRMPLALPGVALPTAEERAQMSAWVRKKNRQHVIEPHSSL